MSFRVYSERINKKTGKKERHQTGWAANPRDRNGMQHWIQHERRADVDQAVAVFKVEQGKNVSRRDRRGNPKPEQRVCAFCDSWQEPNSKSYQENRQTRDRYRRASRRFAELCGDTMLLSEVDDEICEDFIAGYPNDWDGASAMMTAARRAKLADLNPFFGLEKPKKGSRDGILVPEEWQILELADEARAMYGPVFGPVFRSMILTAAYVGPRNGELFGLKFSDLKHRDRFLIDIVRQLDREGVERPPKWDSKRPATIAPIALEAIDEMPGARRLDSPFVYHNKSGGPFTQSALNYYWRPLRERYFGPETDVTWYWLRHWCGSHMADLELDHYAIAMQLGHKDPRVTLRVYIHRNPRLAHKRRLERILCHENTDPYLANYRGRRRAA
jgi:integrase